MWPDIMGLRPAFRDMGRRLAAEGYVVLVPNPFYRSKKAPVMEGPIDFNNPATREVLTGYRKAMSDEGVDNDARAYLAFLDAQPKTNKRRLAGVQGYCMGGTLAFRAAAAVPSRIGAIGSFQPPGLRPSALRQRTLEPLRRRLNCDSITSPLLVFRRQAQIGRGLHDALPKLLSARAGRGRCVVENYRERGRDHVNRERC
jgi:dienelactone hydrolase